MPTLILSRKEINYIRNVEKRIAFDLKLLKNEEIIEKTTYRNIKRGGPKLGILGKVHKEAKYGLLPLCPILSTIGASTYKLAKLLL